MENHQASKMHLAGTDGIVKEAGERESVFQAFCYLLVSLGIQKGYQAVAWFGSLSYGKLHVEKEPRITKCPLRNGEFEGNLP